MERWIFNKERFVSKELDGEHIIVDLNKGDYFTLDGAGGLMFSGILEGKTKDQIRQAVARTYKEVPERTIQRDFDDLIRELRAQKIIETP